jgi:hypothetical protein
MLCCGVFISPLYEDRKYRSWLVTVIVQKTDVRASGALEACTICFQVLPPSVLKYNVALSQAGSSPAAYAI